MASVSKPHGPTNLPLGSPSALNPLIKSMKPKGFSAPPHVTFPILIAVFSYFLWVKMGFNGVSDELLSTLAQGKYADGTALNPSYTGMWPVDYMINMMVAFEYPVTTGADKASWLLMIDLVFTVQAHILWAMMDACRKGRTSALLAYPVAWCLGINTGGAACVLPIYYWLQLSSPPAEHYINLWDAAPLPAAFVLGAILPVLGVFSGPLFPRSALTHQNILALGQFSCVIISVIQTVVAALYPIRNLDVRRRRVAALPTVRLALRISAAFSALGHLFILGNAIFGSTSFASIYLPSSSAVEAAPAATKILEGARYFLQWDFIGICLSTGLWCFYLVTGYSDMEPSKAALKLVGLTLLVGPGATASAVLSLREQAVNDKAEEKRKARLTK